VKIGIEDVDVSQDFEKVLPEKRLTAIRHRLQEKLGIKREPHPTNASKATPSPEKLSKVLDQVTIYSPTTKDPSLAVRCQSFATGPKNRL
jgi:hypothetical protein